jgi:hypothetical protein
MKVSITIQPEELASLVAYLETKDFKTVAPVMQFLKSKVAQAEAELPKEALMPSEEEGAE